MSILKGLVRQFMARPRVTAALGAMVEGVAPILMFHRFADPARGNDGDSVAAVRRDLALLRRERFRLLPLQELLALLADPSCSPDQLRRCVALTIDDGYADFASCGAPAFAEFDCPVTVFVTTGPVDRQCWFWWDVLEYALDVSGHRSLDVEIGGRPISLAWRDHDERARALPELWQALKPLPAEERERTVHGVAEMLGVEVPDAPTAKFEAMTWDEIRGCARSGLVTYGPHTVTHPILSRVDDARAAFEIAESWARLRAECDATVPVFCYPDGTAFSYGDREIAQVAAAGLTAAVTTEPRHASPAEFAPDRPRARFAIPRFAYRAERASFLQVVHGVEHLKGRLRRSAGVPYPGTASERP